MLHLPQNCSMDKEWDAIRTILIRPCHEGIDLRNHLNCCLAEDSVEDRTEVSLLLVLFVCLLCLGCLCLVRLFGFGLSEGGSRIAECSI